MEQYLEQWELPAEWFRWIPEWELFGQSAARWLFAVAVLFAAAIGLRLLKSIFERRIRKLAERTQTTWDDTVVAILGRTRWWFILILAAYAASRVLVLADQTIINTIAILTLLLQTAVWGNVLISDRITRYVTRSREEDPAGVTTVSALAFVAKLVLFSVLALLALDNLGIDVTALIAGLGVGGIAVALAVQNILGDLFASLSIIFDKPFVIGDFVVVGELMGNVETIGIKTTRIRSLSGEQLVFANSDLLQSRIRNFKRMYQRRVVFAVGVTYQTPRTVVEQIPGIIRDVVESQADVRFDRAHFQKFGNFSLDFETVYYVLTPDYNRYMDTQQAINFALMERFEQLGIEFAYPTQTLFLERNTKRESKTDT